MANGRNFYYNPNLGGINAFGAEFGTNNYYAQLAATTDTTFTVPSLTGVGAITNTTPRILAIFTYASGATVYVAKGATAAVLTSASVVTTNGTINPTARIVEAGDVLHFYALAQAYISIEFQAIQ